jgi:hypothetical protein
MVEKEKMFLHELIIPIKGMRKSELSIQEFEDQKEDMKLI